MKRWLILLVPLLVLAIGLPALAEVKLIAPTEPIAVGEYVEITVQGVTDAALPSAKLVLWPREKTTLLPVKTWAGEPRILFKSALPGKYLLFLAVPAKGSIESAQVVIESCEAVVTVGPGDPKPPDPPDPPGPNPGGPFQLMFLFQSDRLDNLPQGQRTILASLKLRKELEAKGHLIRGFFDLDSAKGAPEEFVPFFAGVEDKDLPCVRVAPHAGGKIETFPLPADPAGLWKLLADPNSAAIDQRFLQENHWRLSPGTCGMLGCGAHGGGWILEAAK